MFKICRHFLNGIKHFANGLHPEHKQCEWRPPWPRVLMRSPTKSAVLFGDDEIDPRFSSLRADQQVFQEISGRSLPTDDITTTATMVHYRTKTCPDEEQKRAMASTSVPPKEKHTFKGKLFPARHAWREDTNAALHAGTPGLSLIHI